jgi:hypothetical protein
VDAAVPSHVRIWDSSRRLVVHDALNDHMFPWEPEKYLENYREYAEKEYDGVVRWDGLLLDGWYEVDSGAA